MHSLLTKDQAVDLLDRRLPILADCIRRAIERYEAERERDGPVRARTRACLISDYADQNAQALLDGEDIEFIETSDDTLHIAFADRVILRFKKLDEKLHISYIPTGRATRWAAQEPLEGFPSATNLVAGYTLDELGQLDRIVLVCHKDGRRMWAHDLLEPTATASLMPAPSDGSPGIHRAIVRSGREDAKEIDETA